MSAEAEYVSVGSSSPAIVLIDCAYSLQDSFPDHQLNIVGGWDSVAGGNGPGGGVNAYILPGFGPIVTGSKPGFSGSDMLVASGKIGILC